jgi:hypothetical protein
MAAHRYAVRWWFLAQPAEFYNSGISKLVVRWDKCLNRGGDWKNSQKYLKHCVYFDFPVCILLWLKKNRGKDFLIFLRIPLTWQSTLPFSLTKASSMNSFTSK